MATTSDNKALEAPRMGPPGGGPAPVIPPQGEAKWTPDPYGRASTGTFENKLVVTAGPAKKQFSQYGGDLTKMLATLNAGTGVPGMPNEKDAPTVDNTRDSYTAALDRMASSSDEATKALVSSIQANRMNQKGDIDRQYGNYKAGLQLLGIQHNEAQATPDLLMGHIQQAENEHQAKITQLDVETNKALMDAKKAQDEGDLSILKEKMEYVKQLKAEKNNYLKNIADNMTAQKTIAEAQAGQYYDALEKLDPAEKEAFLVALSKKTNLPLGSIVEALSKERERREDRDLSVRDKKSIIAKRNQEQSEAGGGYTAQEKRKLRAAGIDPTDIEAADEFLYTVKDKDAFYEIADLVVEDPRAVESDEAAHPGYVTADSFKDLLKKAQEYKVPRSEVINRYADKLYTKGSYKRTGKHYGLTEKEWDKIKE